MTHCKSTALRIRRPAASGFTIIELLVVITIIAVLLALALPTLKQAREISQHLKCRSVIRSVAQAAIFYSTDNRDFGPPTTQNSPYQWHRPTLTEYVDARDRTFPPVKGMASYFGYEDDIPEINRRVYYGSRGCPQYSAASATGASAGNAFGGNHYILGMADSRTDPTVRDFWTRLSDATVRPSINLLFFETYNGNYKDVSFSLNGRPGNPYRWAARHKEMGGLNYAFVDGHAKFIRWTDLNPNIMALRAPDPSW